MSKTILHAVSLGLALLLASALAGFGETPGSGASTRKAPMPVGRAEVGVAALDDKVYVVGGTEQAGDGPPRWDSTLNEMYDPVGDVWQERAPLPRGLSHVGLAALGGRLYAIGGIHEHRAHGRPEIWRSCSILLRTNGRSFRSSRARGVRWRWPLSAGSFTSSADAARKRR